MKHGGRLGLRLTVLVVGFAVLFGVPFVVQLRGRPLRYGWHWKLYSGHGMGVCEGYFEDRSADVPVRVDREAVIDASPDERKRHEERLDKSTLPGATYILCLRLREQRPGEEIDLRLHARCSERLGWVTVAEGERNVCTLEGRKALGQQIASARERGRELLHDPWRRFRRRGPGS